MTDDDIAWLRGLAEQACYKYGRPPQVGPYYGTRLARALDELEALREAARMALDFCEFCWRDVALNEFAEERRAGVEHRLREALGDEK